MRNPLRVWAGFGCLDQPSGVEEEGEEFDDPFLVVLQGPPEFE
jgi:hypothetical protein